MSKKSIIIFLLIVAVPALLGFGYFLLVRNERQPVTNDSAVSASKKIIDVKTKALLASIKIEALGKKADYDFKNFCKESARIKDLKESGSAGMCNSSTDGWAVQAEFLVGSHKYICLDSTMSEARESNLQLSDNSIICP